MGQVSFGFLLVNRRVFALLLANVMGREQEAEVAWLGRVGAFGLQALSGAPTNGGSLGGALLKGREPKMGEEEGSVATC